MKRLLAVLVALWLLTACAPSADSRPTDSAASGAPTAASASAALPASIAALVEAARREGRVVVYGTASTPAEEEAVERAFRDYYGFELDLAFESGLHPQKVSELATAARSGVRSGIDVFWSSELILNQLDQVQLLREGTWLAPLDLPAGEILMR